MVIPPVLHREIVSVRPDEAPSSAPSGLSACFMLEVSRRRAQTTKFFFTSEAALARGATSNVQDEFTLLGSVGISDVLRLVASATSDRQRNTQRYAFCTNSFAGFCLRYRQRPAAHGRKLTTPEFSTDSERTSVEGHSRPN